MRGVGCSIVNGVGCNRNKMCFRLSEVFEPARMCSFAPVRAYIGRGDPEEFITIILIKKSGFRKNIYHKNNKATRITYHILLCTLLIFEHVT